MDMKESNVSYAAKIEKKHDKELQLQSNRMDQR